MSAQEVAKLNESDSKIAENKAQTASAYAGVDEKRASADKSRAETAQTKEETRVLRETGEKPTVGSKITATQAANNAEISLARKRLSGMTVTDIKGRTEQFLASGRMNPQYDPTLASTWRTANQRMVGEDRGFDEFANNVTPLKQSRSDSPRARFEADPEMAGKRMGKFTNLGWEVFSQDGNLIGHWK